MNEIATDLARMLKAVSEPISNDLMGLATDGPGILFPHAAMYLGSHGLATTQQENGGWVSTLTPLGEEVAKLLLAERPQASPGQNDCT